MRKSLGPSSMAAANRRQSSINNNSANNTSAKRHSIGATKHTSNLANANNEQRSSRGMSLTNQQQRRSSVMPSGNARKPDDPRQIKDKSYMAKSSRKLILFLSEHGYDRAISPQILSAPTTKDFLSIITFQLRCLDPNFKFVNKYEDEIPAYMKLLGYPYTVSKSALSAVGSPHSWPHLLAAITWLVDLLKYREVVEEREAGDQFDMDDGNKVFVDYLTKSYALFLAGEDEASSLEEQIGFIFEQKNSAFKHDSAALTESIKELTSQLERLTAGPTPLEKAESLNKDLRSDQAKFEAHIHDLTEHRAKLQSRLEAEEAECAVKQQELGAVLAEVAEHKATVSRQELTPVDVQRMHSERNHLEKELAQLKEQKDALSKAQWNQEVQHRSALDQLEARVQQANTTSLRLELVPASAKHAAGRDLALEVAKDGPAYRVISADPDEGIKSAVLHLKAAIAQQLTATQDNLLEAEQGDSRGAQELQELQEELSALRATQQRLDKEEQLMREQKARDLAELVKKTEALHEQILAGRSGIGGALSEAKGSLSAAQAEYDSFVSMANRTRERMYNQVVGVLDTLLSHKAQLEEQVEEVKKHISARAEQLEPLLAM